LSSYHRAQKAQENGFYLNEIVGISLEINGGSQVVNQDELPRTDDLDKLPFLSPAFDKNGGTITQGNGAKIADGAAILVLGEASSNLKPIVRIVGYSTHAESPGHFALAPVEAIKKVLKLCHLKIADIDLFEINEAFAAASIIVNDMLELDAEKVNIHGGSIALGHPIGATGARIMVTLINSLRTKGLKRGLASLCIGGGEATAMVVEIV
jgi:acetyl-CoA C-acetyltransferase